MRRVHTTNAGVSTQYVQVHGRGLGEALEHAVDLLDVQPHVRLPVPAAQHQVVDLFRASTGSLQHAALCDALDHLQGDNVGKARKISTYADDVMFYGGDNLIKGDSCALSLVKYNKLLDDGAKKQ